MDKTIVIESMYLLNYKNPEKGISVGGSQRYTIDLGRLFHKNGYNVIYITKAYKNFEFYHEDWAKIYAINSPFGNKGWIDFSKRVNQLCNKLMPDLVCYSDLQIAWPYCYKNSFALQHGIAWDNPWSNFEKSFINPIKNYLQSKALKNVKKIICVDTNFINWCRARDCNFPYYKDKLIYIPNYADEQIFKFDYKEYKQGDEIILFFPRRFVKHRGFEIFLEMCTNLDRVGYKIRPLLAIEQFRLDEFKKTYPRYGSLKFDVVHPDFNEIAKYYSNAFLTFIPSIWSEGTSLSAIESICSGCPVIASDVGGLGNVIIPHFNGLILPPNAEMFSIATESLINNMEKRNVMAKNCGYVRESLGKSRWESDIMKALEDLFREG